MFCNYCRQLNPNDAIYCSACGRDIGAAPSGQKDSGTCEQTLVSAPMPGDSAPAGNNAKADSPVATDSFSTEELKQFTDEQLDELWRSYIKLQIVPSVAVQQEIKRRALLPGRSVMENSATSSAQIVPTAPAKVQPEIPQPTTSLPEPGDWMTLLNSDIASRPNNAEWTKSTVGSAVPPISKNAVKVEGNRQVASTVGIFRDGKNLIVTRGAQLPGFCLKCGQPSSTVLQKTLYWHPSWLIILIFLGWLPYVIAVMVVRTRMDLALPLCIIHREKYKNRRRASLAILVASIGLLLSCFYLSDHSIPIALSLGLIGLLTAGILWEVASTLLRANVIDAHKGSFRGADERFLQKCSQRPPA